jgi:hypothetical protein
MTSGHFEHNAGGMGVAFALNPREHLFVCFHAMICLD